MLNGVKKISLLFILTFGFQQLIHAQYSKPVKDTLEDYFNLRAAHKDGYDFASRVIDIPSNIVQKYDSIVNSGEKVYFFIHKEIPKNIWAINYRVEIESSQRKQWLNSFEDIFPNKDRRQETYIQLRNMLNLFYFPLFWLGHAHLYK